MDPTDNRKIKTDQRRWQTLHGYSSQQHLRLNYRLTSTIHYLQRLFIHKKISPARLVCLCFIAVGVFPVELWLSLPSFNDFCCKLALTAIDNFYILLILFSNLNISGIDADIFKLLMAFSFFYEMLCDTPKKIKVPL